MKHTITDDVNANVNANINIKLPTEDIKELIDKVTEAGITIIMVHTAAHILKSFFGNHA